MVQLSNMITVFLSALLVGESMAHPGMSMAELKKEIAERSAYLKTAKRDLSHCSSKLQSRGLEQRGLDRRAATLAALRSEVAQKSMYLPTHRGKQVRG